MNRAAECFTSKLCVSHLFLFVLESEGRTIINPARRMQGKLIHEGAHEVKQPWPLKRVPSFRGRWRASHITPLGQPLGLF